MKAQTTYPTVRSVRPLPDMKLQVSFSTGEVRIYDCGPLLSQPPFRALEDERLFSQVHPAPHGYAVIWNDEIDLAESELWIHGAPIEPDAAPNCGPIRPPGNSKATEGPSVGN